MNKNKHSLDIERERGRGRGEREAFASLRSQTLSGEEKSTMRQVLHSSVNQSRAAVSRPERRVIGFFSPFFGRSFAVLALSIVLIIGSSFGVARAAERSLPGEALYPVKTQFNEPLVASLKTSDAARAEWEHTLVERRIAEAETLAEEGRLGDNEKNEIEQRLSKHRAALDRIEGHEITDDEFIPNRPVNDAKKIKVFLEHRENGAHVRIEERGEENNGDQGGADSSDGRVEGVWQENGTSSEEHTGEEMPSKKSEGNAKSESRSKSETAKKAASDQKAQTESDQRNSLSEKSISSGDQKAGQDNSGQDGGSEGYSSQQN